MNSEILVEQFCTPPQNEETDFDRKAFADAENMEIEFEGRLLKGYSLGTGKTVLLVHGWGSRASHLILLARFLTKNGYRAVVFDAPAHGNSRKENDVSNMFEMGRAISTVVKKVGPIYGLIAHSLGASAALFALAGTGHLSAHTFEVEKLILISTPISVERIIENYSRNKNEMDAIGELTLSLENAFNFRATDYNLLTSLQSVKSSIMIIHDEQDEEIPVSEALMLKEADERILLKITTGYGHQKILMNREMLNSVKEFLEL